MGGFAKGLRRILTPPKFVRRALTPPGGKDWIKEYEVGPKLAALGTAAIPGVGPYIGAGIGAMTVGTTEAGKALAEGRPWMPAAVSGGAQGFGYGYAGGGVADIFRTAATAARVDPEVLKAMGGGTLLTPSGAEVSLKAGSTGVGRFMAGLGAGLGFGGGTAERLATGAAGTAGAGTTATGLSRLVGPALAIGSAAAAYGRKPPTAEFGTPAENLERARESLVQTYLGEAGAALPRATREQYLDLVTLPVGELSGTFRNLIKPQLDETTRLINEQFDTRDEEIDAQFAQAGGIGSSDHLRAKNEARQLRTQETRRARFEIEANGLREQINVKLDAMARGLQAGQFDTNIAFELAKLQGTQDELIAAIQFDDYDTFQTLMGQLFQAGLYETFIGQTQMPSLT